MAAAPYPRPRPNRSPAKRAACAILWTFRFFAVPARHPENPTTVSPQEDQAHPHDSSVPETVEAVSGDVVRAPAGASGLDRATLERVRDRDPAALGLLFDACFPRVFSLIHRLLGDRTLAEDAASEVFLKVHRAAHTIDPGRDPSPWLSTIATNVCRDLWRSGAYRMSRRAASVHDEVVANRLTSGADEPESNAIVHEREHMVRGALAALPDSLRVAIVLHDYDGLSHQEVADATGIEHAAARKRYSRALAALAKLLQGKIT